MNRREPNIADCVYAPMTPNDLAVATWVATENIARFQSRLAALDHSTDRQMLDAAIVVERARLAGLASDVRALKASGLSSSKSVE